MSQIYLDACATSPPHKKVMDRMRYVNEECWANASSVHVDGVKSAEILERSRESISIHLNCKSNEIVFTSGATESIFLAILGVTRYIKPAEIIISSIEHPSVIAVSKLLEEKGWLVKYCPVNNVGSVDIDFIEKSINNKTKLVSVIWGQGEIGTIQPINNIGNICRSKGVIFHSDATQMLSQGLFDWNQLPIDILSTSVHKIQGPKGIGMLLVREAIKNRMSPMLIGGNQEDSLRAGTEPVALIAGMDISIQQLTHSTTDEEIRSTFGSKAVAEMTNRLRNKLVDIRGVKLTGDPTNRLNHHISLIVGDENNIPVSGRTLVRELSKLGVSASSGSACSSGVMKDSYVLQAMGIDSKWLRSGLRFTLGPWLNDSDLCDVPEILQEAIIRASI